MSLPGFLFPDADPDGASLTALARNAYTLGKFLIELSKYFIRFSLLSTLSSSVISSSESASSFVTLFSITLNTYEYRMHTHTARSRD